MNYQELEAEVKKLDGWSLLTPANKASILRSLASLKVPMMLANLSSSASKILGTPQDVEKANQERVKFETLTLSVIARTIGKFLEDQNTSSGPVIDSTFTVTSVEIEPPEQ